MKYCNHENFDEYFERCIDCNADRTQVIADSFRDSLQANYKNALDALGIKTGDIAPEQSFEIERLENELSIEVAKWLVTRSK